MSELEIYRYAILRKLVPESKILQASDVGE